MTKVYVIHEPHRLVAGRLEPQYDTSAAELYGERVRLLKPGVSPFRQPQRVIEELRRGLSSFTEDDYLLAIGNPVLLAWATVVAVEMTGGPVKLLQWSRQEGGYYRSVEVNFDAVYTTLSAL